MGSRLHLSPQSTVKSAVTDFLIALYIVHQTLQRIGLRCAGYLNRSRWLCHTHIGNFSGEMGNPFLLLMIVIVSVDNVILLTVR